MRRVEKFDRPWYGRALELLTPNTKILDLGCGLGEFARLARNQKNCDVICVDGEPKYVDHVKKLGFPAYRVNLEKEMLPFKDGFLDGVVALEVLEHIKNTDGILREVNRVLKPKGYLVLSTPNPAWIGHRMSCLFGYPPHEEGYHLRFFTKKKLERCLEENGFEIIKWNSFTGSLKITLWQSLLAFSFVLRAHKRKRRESNYAEKSD